MRMQETKAEQLSNSCNYRHHSYLNRDYNRATRRNYQNRSIVENQNDDDTTDTGEIGNNL